MPYITKPPDPYPLTWPAGKIRTKPHRREYARFKVTPDQAMRQMLEELKSQRRYGARNVVVTSNIPLRKDGLPYASYRKPEDPGVSVYFEVGGEPHFVACDRFNTVGDNVRAIGLTLENMRRNEAYGVITKAEALQAAKLLPPPPGALLRPWYEVLEVSPAAGLEVIEAAYRAKARKLHPDAGGNAADFAELAAALDEAKAERGVVITRKEIGHGN